MSDITSDNEDSVPLIVNGRPLKSMNQYYNKKLAKLNQEYSRHKIHTGKRLRNLNFRRTMKLKDYLHKASRRVTDWCILNNIKAVYVGHNAGWKQNCDMGKKNNQKFVQIPFNMFIQQLTYKLNDVGIDVEITNEAYTSKCSFLDGESVGKHDEYCGSKIRRGLFQTKDNTLINADVNGSLNILRLGIKRDFKSNGCFNPKKLNDVNEICDVAYLNWQPTDRGSVLEPYTNCAGKVTPFEAWKHDRIHSI